jgi:uncharacterized protein DUF3185
MQRIVGAVLLVVGAILLFYGLSAGDSFGSEVSKFFTGKPTDKTIWLVVGGAASIVAGLLFIALPPRSGVSVP